MYGDYTCISPTTSYVKDAVDKELEHLQQAGIVEKVTHSDWSAPIVVVPKGDGQIRLCGDYKVTVNKSLEVDQHPLLRPDQLFAAFSRGVKFSKIDLTHAYQQMYWILTHECILPLTLTKAFSSIPAYRLALRQLQQFFNA